MSGVTLPREIPALGQCTQCGERWLHSSYDITRSGTWHYCFHCKHTDSDIGIIGTAYRHERVEQTLALVEKVRGIKFSKKTKAELVGRATRQRAFTTFMTSAAKNAAANVAGNVRLLRTLSKLNAGAGTLDDLADINMVGTRAAFDTSLQINDITTKKPQASLPSLIYPFATSAGNYVGAFFVSGDGHFRDTEYRAINPVSEVDATYDAGFFGLTRLHSCTQNTAEPVIVVDCPLLAARMHTRNAMYTRRILPIIAWIDRGKFRTDRGSWWNLGERKKILVMRQLNAAIIYQAITANAHITVISDTAQFENLLNSQTVVDTYNYLVKGSTPWYSHLRQLRYTRPELLSQLLDDLYTDYGVPVRAIAEQLNFAAYTLKEKEIGIEELDNGATLVAETGNVVVRLPKDNKRVVLSDALVVTTAIDNSGDEVYCQGYVVFRKQRIPFNVTYDSLDRTLVKTIRMLCLKDGLGRPYFNEHVKKLTGLTWFDVMLRLFSPAHAIVTSQANHLPARYKPGPLD